MGITIVSAQSTLVDVAAGNAVSMISRITVASERTNRVGARSVIVAVVGPGSAFVNIVTRDTGASVAGVALTSERTKQVLARGVCVTVIGALGAFVNIVALTLCPRTIKARVRSASEGTNGVGACTSRAAWIAIAFIDVHTRGLDEIDKIAFSATTSEGTDGVHAQLLASMRSFSTFVDVVALRTRSSVAGVANTVVRADSVAARRGEEAVICSLVALVDIGTGVPVTRVPGVAVALIRPNGVLAGSVRITRSARETLIHICAGDPTSGVARVAATSE